MIKTVEGILFSLGVLAIMLIALYGTAHLIVRFSPSPVNAWFTKALSYTSPAGWTTSS
jgi:Na+-transporting methylmalonyl-CoA/oxaloacetate decarboxylase gamma subunit